MNMRLNLWRETKKARAVATQTRAVAPMNQVTLSPAPSARDEVEIFVPPSGASKNWLPPKSAPDKARLDELEAIIARHKRAFAETGAALTEIRDRRLYRDKYRSFDAYCRQRWNFQKSYAYKLIRTAAAVETVCPRGHSATDLSPRVVSALERVSDPQAREIIMDDATRPDGSVSVKKVEAAVERLVDPMQEPPADVLDELRRLEDMLFGLLPRVNDVRVITSWLDKLSRRVSALRR